MARKPKTPEYLAFISIKARCRNQKHRTYFRYGGRGIELRFNTFTEFLQEIGERPSPRHSVDRIDNEGHYEPGNVRWATAREQSNNRRSNRKIKAFGAVLTVAEWSRITKIHSNTILSRIDNYGWAAPEALTTPRYARCRRTSATL